MMRSTLKREGYVWGVVAVLTVLYVLASYGLDRAYDNSRWYRDLMHYTPFYDVRITHVEVTAHDMVVSGTLKKRRCEKIGHAVYARVDNMLLPGIFSVDEEPEGTPENRPISSDEQSFGPWRITSYRENPDRGIMYVYHRCPEGVVSNLVFDLPWKNLE